MDLQDWKKLKEWRIEDIFFENPREVGWAWIFYEVQ